MTSHHEDILPLVSEQRRCQQAVLIECFVRTAPRSPPLFRLEQRHRCLNARGPTKMVYYLAAACLAFLFSTLYRRYYGAAASKHRVRADFVT